MTTTNERRQASIGLAQVAEAYREDLRMQAERVGDPAWVAAMEAVVRTLDGGRLVMLAGNGGSASTAIHIGSDWRAAGYASRRPGRVTALSENLSRVLAIANDVGFEQVFSRQVLELAGPGDLLVVCSVSGCSENLVTATEAARAVGASVVGLLGAPGELADRCDAAWIAGDVDFGTCEDLHLAFGHCVVRALLGGPQTTSQQAHGTP